MVNEAGSWHILYHLACFIQNVPEVPQSAEYIL